MVIKSTKTKYSYLEPFLTTRESLHLLDISRKLKENHATVRKYLNKFEKQGILKKEIKGRLTLYKLNPAHHLRQLSSASDFHCPARKTR